MTADETVLEKLRNALDAPDRPGAKYAYLEAELSALIAGKTLLPGDRLPADKLFADQVGVSLGTMQRALVSLHKQGLLTRAPKRGTVVADRQVGEEGLYVFRFRDADTGALLLPRVRTISVTEYAQKGPWLDFLRAERAICVERILQISVEPPVYSQVFIPHEHGAALLDRPMDAFTGFSVHRHVEDCHGSVMVRSQSEVRLGSFKGRAAQQLNLDEGTSSLIWEVSSFTAGDRPASFQRIQIPPNHRPLEFRRAYGD